MSIHINFLENNNWCGSNWFKTRDLAWVENEGGLQRIKCGPTLVGLSSVVVACIFSFLGCFIHSCELSLEDIIQILEFAR